MNCDRESGTNADIYADNGNTNADINGNTNADVNENTNADVNADIIAK